MAIGIGDALLKVGVDKKDFDRDMNGLSGAINKHKKAIGAAMIGMGVAAIGGAVASVKAFADAGDAVHKMALRTEFSTEALSEWKHVAEISGTSLQSLEKGVKKMSKTIVDADDGMATYIRSFDRIGLSAEELIKLSPEEQFDKITLAIAALENPTLQAATAQDIFGRAGTELLPVMKAGADGIELLKKEAHELGIVFDQEAADKAALLKDNLTRLEGAVNGVKFALAQELTPALEDAIPTLTELAKTMGPVIANVINWHREYDSLTAAQRQGVKVQHQANRAAQGWNNTLTEELDIYESLLKKAGRYDDAMQASLKSLRELADAHQDNTEAIDSENEAIAEQNALLEEQQAAYETTIDKINDAIQEMKYEESQAGSLGITLDDVITALHKMGKSNEYIADTLVKLGDEQDNVLKVMDAFGISAEKIAEILGLQTDEVEKLKEAYEDLHQTVPVVDTPEVTEAKSATEVQAGEHAEQEIFWGGRYQTRQSLWGQGITDAMIRKELLRQQSEFEKMLGGKLPSFANEGIAMRPMVASIAENKPEAVLSIDRLEGMIGGRTADIRVYLDRRTLIEALGQPLVDKIRLRTGGHI